MEIGWWKDKSQKITEDVEENQNWKLGFKNFWKSKLTGKICTSGNENFKFLLC
jgi:hypothetical protein